MGSTRQGPPRISAPASGRMQDIRTGKSTQPDRNTALNILPGHAANFSPGAIEKLLVRLLVAFRLDPPDQSRSLLCAVF